MGYFKDLYETFIKQPINILCTSFLIWVISPIIIFGIWGIVQVLFYSSLNFEIFTTLLSNAIIPWWTSIIINFKKFVLEYIFSIILTIVLVNHNILKTIGFQELIAKLKRL